MIVPILLQKINLINLIKGKKSKISKKIYCDLKNFS